MLPSNGQSVQGTIIRGVAPKCATPPTFDRYTLKVSLDCQTYLEELLPALLRIGQPPTRDVVLQFVVADGSNVFYRIGAEGVEVGRGVSDRVDLTLAFRKGRDVVGFARAELDLVAALRTQRLKIHGGEELLPWLAERLSW